MFFTRWFQMEFFEWTLLYFRSIITEVSDHGSLGQTVIGVFHTTISNGVLWMKIIVFSFNYHRSVWLWILWPNSYRCGQWLRGAMLQSITETLLIDAYDLLLNWIELNWTYWLWCHHNRLSLLNIKSHDMVASWGLMERYLLWNTELDYW